MKRLRRRFWTYAITAGAGLVLAAAVVSGLFQVAVQAMPGYRADVERYVRDVTGRPIRIGALGLTWRYYYPSLELVDVALLEADGTTVALEAERLRLGFALTRLVRGEFAPNRLELHGLTLEVTRERDGTLRVQGLDLGAPAADADAAPSEALQHVAAFDLLRLERCRLNVRNQGRRDETWSFGIAYAELNRGLLGRQSIDAELTLPAAFGDSARVEATLSGDALVPATWSGRWSAELTGLSAGPWLTPYLAPGAALELSGTEAVLRGQFKDGTLTRADLQLQTGPVRGRRAAHRADLESLDARVKVEFVPEGWRAEVERFALETRNGAWPRAGAKLSRLAEGGGAPVLEARADFLRLSDLAPWLSIVRVPVPEVALDDIAGELREVALTLRGDGDDRRFTLRTRFSDLALPAAGRAAGFAGAAGELAADEKGGRVILSERPFTVELPGVLLTPQVTFDALDGDFEWRRERDGWRLRAPAFSWRMLTTVGRGRLDLALPDAEGASPVIDLEADFSAQDGTAAKPLMPLAWGRGLQRWLDESIVAARVPSAKLSIKGPLADFPFHERQTGAWSLEIQAEDAVLAYQPDWPAIEALGARLRFRGNSLAIEATHGTTVGNPIKSAVARFPDFATGELYVDATVEGETARFYDFLARSPLKRTLAGLINGTTAQGPAAVEVHLMIPVKNAVNTTVDGAAILKGVELRPRALNEPIRNIQGRVAFGNSSIAADRLTAQLYEIPLVASITPRADGTSLLSADLGFTLDPEGRGASVLVPAWIRRKLWGASAWRAELPIGSKLDAPLKLTTDLAGVEVRLPPPLGKPAEQVVPLELTVDTAPGAPLRVTVDYQQRFGADLRFTDRRGVATLSSAALRLGGGPRIDAAEPGIVLSGAAAELDLRAWSDELKGAGLGTQVSAFKRADVHLGRAVWGPYALRDTGYQWVAAKGGWQLTLVGTGAAGELRWSGADKGLLTARLDALTVDRLDDTGADGGAPADPATLPRIDVDVQRLQLGPANLGHVVVASERIPGGQRLAVLKIDGGVLKMSGGGEWVRVKGKSSGALDFAVESTDFSAVLRAAGYTPNLDARSAKATGKLAFPPAADGLALAQAQGSVRLLFENGQLRAVEPGAGRVLGLVNFYALPRRLTLNFRDVLSSGLGFDRIEGDFALAGGHARTDNLAVDGPSLRMDLRGRIGLADRDYDQTVTVYPDVSAGVTLGSLLLGGPVAGVLALIAQEVLDKPLNQVTQLSYRVTGSWDNPQVERVSEDEAERASRPRPSGHPGQKP